MKPPRLFFYLLLNVIVSAVVVMTVLYFYDRSHRTECITVLPNTTTASAGKGSENISITSIIGAGGLAEESVVIQNLGKQEADLNGWFLANDKGLKYVFPQLTLAPGSKVQVHTASGKDTPTDLYWGRSASAWTSGDLVSLYDAQAVVRAFYRVP